MGSTPAPHRRSNHRAPVMAMTTGLPYPPVEPDLLDQAEVARRLNVSRTTIWRLVKRGDIRTVPIGGRTLIPRTELQRLIANGTAVAP